MYYQNPQGVHTQPLNSQASQMSCQGVEGAGTKREGVEVSKVVGCWAKPVGWREIDNNPIGYGPPATFAERRMVLDWLEAEEQARAARPRPWIVRAIVTLGYLAVFAAVTVGTFWFLWHYWLERI